MTLEKKYITVCKKISEVIAAENENRPFLFLSKNIYDVFVEYIGEIKFNDYCLDYEKRPSFMGKKIYIIKDLHDNDFLYNGHQFVISFKEE